MMEAPTDTQNFGQYNIIPLSLFVVGHKKTGIKNERQVQN